MKIEKLKNKDGTLRWRVRYEENGRGSKKVSRRFEKQIEAQEFVDQQMAIKKEKRRLALGGLANLPQTDFQTEADLWLAEKKVVFSPGYFDRAQGIVEELKPKYGTFPPERFHFGLLTQIQSDLIAEGLSHATVNRKLEVLKAIFNYSAKKRRILANPTHGFPKLKEVRGDMMFWERHEAETFLAYANQKYPPNSPKRWIYVAYLTSLNTAIRAAEEWGLQPSDLIQTGNLLHIQRQYDKVSHEFRPTKGKKSRYVPCNDGLRKELMTLIETRKGQTIFCNEDGQPICHEVFVNSYFRKDAKAAGVRRIRFHDLRHTAITLMIAAGVDINTVKSICGHQNIMTTMGYVHLLGDSVKQVAKMFSVTAGSTAKIPSLVLISNQ